MHKKTHILMVCLGNICRSPLAEGILKSKLDPQRFDIESAGTGNWHVGEQPDHRSIETAKRHQIDISKQIARHFNVKDFDIFDLIFAMNDQNYKDLQALATNENAKNKIHKIVAFDANHHKEIPDPYYGTLADFEHVFQLLDGICENIAQQFRNKNFPY
jgi:protein-tyrosine phosphatase